MHPSAWTRPSCRKVSLRDADYCTRVVSVCVCEVSVTLVYPMLILSHAGQKWKLRRKQLNPAFNHNIVVSFFDVFNSVGNQLIEQFATQSHLHGDGVKFKDAEDMLSRAVLEVSCRE